MTLKEHEVLVKRCEEGITGHVFKTVHTGSKCMCGHEIPAKLCVRCNTPFIDYAALRRAHELSDARY